MPEANILNEIVFLSFGAAVNPTNLTIILIYLGSPNLPFKKGSTFYAGNFIAAFIWSFLSLLFGAALLAIIPHFSTVVSASIDLIVAILLLILAIYFFKRKKPQKHDKAEDAKKDPGLLKIFSLGLFMNMANYSSVPLLFVASKDVGLTGLPFDVQMILLLIICLIMNIMVEIPLLFYIIEKQKAANVLRKANTLFTAKGNLIIGAYLFIISIYLIWRGLNVLKLF